MKRLHLFILVSFVFNLTYSQNRLKGYITQYEHGDSVINCKVYHSTVVYDQEGKETRREWLMPLSFKDERKNEALMYRVMLDGSGIPITGLFEQLENTEYLTSYNQSNNKEYLIENQDTSIVFETLFGEENKAVKRTCLYGCDYSQQYTYNDDLGYTMSTIYNSGDTLFSVFEIDDEGREIYSKINMNSIDQKDFEYIKVDYKDNIRMEIREHGNTDSLNKTVTTIFYAKSGFPIYETIEYYQGDDKIRWVIEYE